MAPLSRCSSWCGTSLGSGRIRSAGARTASGNGGGRQRGPARPWAEGRRAIRQPAAMCQVRARCRPPARRSRPDTGAPVSAAQSGPDPAWGDTPTRPSCGRPDTPIDRGANAYRAMPCSCCNQRSVNGIPQPSGDESANAPWPPNTRVSTACCEVASNGMLNGDNPNPDASHSWW